MDNPYTGSHLCFHHLASFYKCNTKYDGIIEYRRSQLTQRLVPFCHVGGVAKFPRSASQFNWDIGVLGPDGGSQKLCLKKTMYRYKGLQFDEDGS